MEGARPAVPGDAGRLAALRAEATAHIVAARGGRLLRAEMARRGPVVERLAVGVDPAEGMVTVGTIDEVVVGYGSARVDDLPDGERIGVIEEVYVEPGARGVGVGEAIMDAMTTWCVALGCDGLDGTALPGDRTAKGFFERHGMTARLLVMHRRLPAGE